MAKKAENKPETTDKAGITAAKKPEAKAEVIQPLPVEVHFPNIMDLKQAIAFDGDGQLIIAIQFKARVNQFEVFRLLNLLKQPNGGLSATISSPQSAMDFYFNDKEGTVQVIKAAVKTIKSSAQIAGPKTTEKALPDNEAYPAASDVVKIHFVHFHHIPEETLPFGVAIDYINQTGEIKIALGRGKNPTDAVIDGVRWCGLIRYEGAEPFEVRAALENLETSTEGLKLIRVIDHDSFEIIEDTEEDKGE